MKLYISMLFFWLLITPLLLLASGPAVEKLYTPFDVVNIVYADTQSLLLANDPAVDPHYVRYLDLRSVSKTDRPVLKQAIDFALNSYNTKYRKIVRTAILPAGQLDPIVIRVNLKDYAISSEAWDYLAENGSGNVPIPDYFYHVFITQQINTTSKYQIVEETVNRSRTRYNRYGKPYIYRWKEKVRKRRRITSKPIVKKVFAAAPWLALEDDPKLRGTTIASIISATNTKNPILNGEWFLTYSGWTPAYWKFIGLKGNIVKVGDTFQIKGGEKEFEKLALFDRKKARASQIAAIADSKIVTLHNRILIRFPTVAGLTGGYYWSSFDTKKGIDDEDYLNNVANFENPKIAAKEIIATAINTLQIYAVSNDKGDLLSEADPKVAIHGDKMPTKLQDKVIYAGIRNCALCHSEGMVAIDDRVRDLAQGQIALFIQDKLQLENKYRNFDLVKKIEDAFSPNLKDIIRFDIAIHTTAIRACNGLTPQQNINAYENFIVSYYDKYVTLEKAAREAGWRAGDLETVLKSARAADYSNDYTVTALLSPKVKPSRLPWERQGYANLMTFLLTRPKPK